MPMQEMQEIQVRSLGQEDLVGGWGEWQLSPVFLPGEFQGQRSLVGHSPWGLKELDMTERLTLESQERKSERGREGRRERVREKREKPGINHECLIKVN